MSLIADALKAAQWERSGADLAGRRHRAAAGLVKKPIPGPTPASRIPLPRTGLTASIRISLCVLLLAVGAATALVLHGRAARLRASAEVGPVPPAAPSAQPSQREMAQALLGAATPLEAQAATAASDAFPDPDLPGNPEGSATILEAPVVAAVTPAPQTVQNAPGSGAPAQPATPATGTEDLSGSFELTLAPTRAQGTEFRDAVAAQRRGDHRAAVALYQRLLGRLPGHAEAANNLGTSQQALGDLEAARAAYLQALDLDPGYASAWSNLAGVLALLGDPSGSRAALAETVRLDPGNGAAGVNLANAYAAAGDHPSARRLLEEVLRADPAMPEAHYALARVHEAGGDRRAAAAAYRRFLQLAGSRFPELAAPVRDRITTLERGL